MRFYKILILRSVSICLSALVVIVLFFLIIQQGRVDGFIVTDQSVQDIELVNEIQGIVRAKVIEITHQEARIIRGTNTESLVQTIQAQVLEGVFKDEVVEIINDYHQLQEGQYFFMNYMGGEGGEYIYSVRDVDRRSRILFVVGMFAVVVVLFGGKQGIRSLLSLAGSLLAILFILIPMLLAGYPPVMTSVGVGIIVLFSAIFFTHGFSKQSLLAFSGTVAGVLATGILASFSIWITYLTGFATEDTVYLNFSTQGTLDLKGLLLGSIIIGVLGVLDDIAITQVAVVAELKRAASHLTSTQLFERALRVGREHVSALVNTLVLAYAGVSLPLILLFYQSDAAFMTIINQELFANEIVRTVVGSIGLLLTVPLSTLFAVLYLKDEDLESIDSPSCGHAHAHVHKHHHDV
jgi:uncharacterized membrane protein